MLKKNPTISVEEVKTFEHPDQQSCVQNIDTALCSRPKGV